MHWVKQGKSRQGFHLLRHHYRKAHPAAWPSTHVSTHSFTQSRLPVMWCDFLLLLSLSWLIYMVQTGSYSEEAAVDELHLFWVSAQPSALLGKYEVVLHLYFEKEYSESTLGQVLMNLNEWPNLFSMFNLFSLLFFCKLNRIIRCMYLSWVIYWPALQLTFVLWNGLLLIFSLFFHSFSFCTLGDQCLKKKKVGSMSFCA